MTESVDGPEGDEARRQLNDSVRTMLDMTHGPYDVKTQEAATRLLRRLREEPAWERISTDLRAEVDAYLSTT